MPAQAGEAIEEAEFEEVADAEVGEGLSLIAIGIISYGRLVVWDVTHPPQNH